METTEFKKDDKVYYFLGASIVRCTIYEVRKATVRVITPCGQIIKKRKEEVRRFSEREAF